jgi:hypothetical protein
MQKRLFVYHSSLPLAMANAIRYRAAVTIRFGYRRGILHSRTSTSGTVPQVEPLRVRCTLQLCKAASHGSVLRASRLQATLRLSQARRRGTHPSRDPPLYIPSPPLSRLGPLAQSSLVSKSRVRDALCDARVYAYTHERVRVSACQPRAACTAHARASARVTEATCS